MHKFLQIISYNNLINSSNTGGAMGALFLGPIGGIAITAGAGLIA